VLLISLAGAAIDYVVMAFAPEFWMLVVGRAIAGLTSANMAVATAYITDISAEEVRAKRFGYFHAMFGVGFIIGPVLGGVLGDVWVRAPFIAAALLNAANFALALFVLPESRPGDAGTKFDLKTLNPFKPLGWALGFRALLPLIGVFVVLNFVGTIYGTVWALFATDAFKWNATMIGLSLGAWGLLHAGVQIVLVGPVVARIGERAALLAGVSCELAAFVVTAIATDGWIIFAIMPLYALSGLGIPALQSLTTQQVDADNQGKLQGVLSSLVSLSAVFGPLFFSYAYFLLRPSWPGVIWLAGGAVYLLALPLMLGLRKSPENKPKPAVSG
jgi:DHA1 family tetracycline resistance protein-like MFS transporter